jgi:hypothetical protein
MRESDLAAKYVTSCDEQVCAHELAAYRAYGVSRFDPEAIRATIGR